MRMHSKYFPILAVFINGCRDQDSVPNISKTNFANTMFYTCSKWLKAFQNKLFTCMLDFPDIPPFYFAPYFACAELYTFPSIPPFPCASTYLKRHEQLIICCICVMLHSLSKLNFKGFLLNAKGDATSVALSGSPGRVPPGSPPIHNFPKSHPNSRLFLSSSIFCLL